VVTEAALCADREGEGKEQERDKKGARVAVMVDEGAPPAVFLSANGGAVAVPTEKSSREDEKWLRVFPAAGFDLPKSMLDRRMKVHPDQRPRMSGPLMAQAGLKNPGPGPGCGLGVGVSCASRAPLMHSWAGLFREHGSGLLLLLGLGLLSLLAAGNRKASAGLVSLAGPRE
jgi:hypothetical protein